MNEINRSLPPGLGGTNQQGAQRANRLAEQATKAIANVGHTNPFEGHENEARAIVQVANMLSELMDWRGGRRVEPRRQTEDHTLMLVEGAIHGSKNAIEYVSKLVMELQEWRRGQRPEQRSLDSEKGQARAWEAVFETINQHNPDAFAAGGSGASMAKAELERLYQAEGEAESAKKVIRELERMGWLMKQAKG